jgi:UDP-N-acetylmuramoyl-tripeptide--D-alanyl-D-alanine ligase
MIVLAVARNLGLDMEAVSESLTNVRLPDGRCEVIESEKLTLLKDSYNSNPGSLRASLEAANAMRRGRRLIVILGTMLELGSDSTRLHAELADCVMDYDPHIVAVMGEFIPAFERYAERLGDCLITAADPETVGPLVAACLSGDELVLIKGSRGVRLERVIPYLHSTEEKPCSTTS